MLWKLSRNVLYSMSFYPWKFCSRYVASCLYCFQMHFMQIMYFYHFTLYRPRYLTVPLGTGTLSSGRGLAHSAQGVRYFRNLGLSSSLLFYPLKVSLCFSPKCSTGLVEPHPASLPGQGMTLTGMVLNI